jgi:phage terminase small subunit
LANDLTRKQQIFIAEYLKDSNGTRAALAAGYSKNGAESTASTLLRNPKVSEVLSKKTASILEKLGLSAEKVLKELMKLAFLDARKFYNDDGSLKLIPELDDDTAAALAGMEIEEAYEHFGKGQAKATGIIKKIKFADKGQNLERLGRHLKLFTDKLEVTETASLAESIRKARERAKK